MNCVCLLQLQAWHKAISTNCLTQLPCWELPRTFVLYLVFSCCSLLSNCCHICSCFQCFNKQHQGVTLPLLWRELLPSKQCAFSIRWILSLVGCRLECYFYLTLLDCFLPHGSSLTLLGMNKKFIATKRRRGRNIADLAVREGSFHLLLLAEKFRKSTLITMGLKLCCEVTAQGYHLSPEILLYYFFKVFIYRPQWAVEIKLMLHIENNFRLNIA